MKSYWFLFWAYNVIWAGLAIWLFVLLRSLRRLDARMDRVEREVGEPARESAPAEGRPAPPAGG